MSEPNPVGDFAKICEERLGIATDRGGKGGPSLSIPCPACGHGEAWIIDKRGVRRRRECGRCGARYTTMETLWNAPERPRLAEASEAVFDAIVGALAPYRILRADPATDD